MALTNGERATLEEYGVARRFIQQVEDLLRSLDEQEAMGSGPESRWALERLEQRASEGADANQAILQVLRRRLVPRGLLPVTRVPRDEPRRWSMFNWMRQNGARLILESYEQHLRTPLQPTETVAASPSSGEDHREPRSRSRSRGEQSEGSLDEALPDGLGVAPDEQLASAELRGIWREPVEGAVDDTLQPTDPAASSSGTNGCSTTSTSTLAAVAADSLSWEVTSMTTTSGSCTEPALSGLGVMQELARADEDAGDSGAHDGDEVMMVQYTVVTVVAFRHRFESMPVSMSPAPAAYREEGPWGGSSWPSCLDSLTTCTTSGASCSSTCGSSSASCLESSTTSTTSWASCSPTGGRTCTAMCTVSAAWVATAFPSTTTSTSSTVLWPSDVVRDVVNHELVYAGEGDVQEVQRRLLDRMRRLQHLQRLTQVALEESLRWLTVPSSNMPLNAGIQERRIWASIVQEAGFGSRTSESGGATWLDSPAVLLQPNLPETLEQTQRALPGTSDQVLQSFRRRAWRTHMARVFGESNRGLVPVAGVRELYMVQVEPSRPVGNWPPSEARPLRHRDHLRGPMRRRGRVPRRDPREGDVRQDGEREEALGEPGNARWVTRERSRSRSDDRGGDGRHSRED